MKKSLLISLACALISLPFPHLQAAKELVLAGGSEVFIIDADKAEGGVIEKVWRWSGMEAPEVPDQTRKDFDHMDECKPVDGGRKLLVCASNGGCALIERATKRVLWTAHVTNAHSLALLPHDRVVVASSLSGDQLVVFDLARSGAVVCTTPLHSAHGLVWDDARHCLWALSHDDLRAYELVDWESAKPALKLQATYALPDKDGHDLRPAPGRDELILSTAATVQIFELASHSFHPHPLLGTMPKVKSVDLEPATGRIVVSEWGPKLRLLSPDGRIEFKAERPYKARWMTSP
jgi:Family of unknown function (DUF6528)